MLFVTYWELNESMPVEERQAVARKLTEAGHFPPENVQVLRWDVTPDGWGILITEARSAGDIAAALNVWRAAGPGFFRLTRTAPASPVQQAMADAQAVLDSL